MKRSVTGGENSSYGHHVEADPSLSDSELESLRDALGSVAIRHIEDFSLRRDGQVSVLIPEPNTLDNRETLLAGVESISHTLETW